MSEKYIRKNKTSYTIVKGSKTYAKVSSLDDAIFIRDFLIKNDWDLTKTPQIIKNEDIYLIVTVYEDKIHILSKYRQKPAQETIDKLVKRHERNPNNSRYGLNITRVFDTFAVKKRIAGDDYVFGYYDNLADAEFVRNFLMDNSWNVNEFSQIGFDEETGKYMVVEVIDDRVYVLDSFADDDINLDRVHEEFLAQISKHKHGLSSHPHLDLLKDSIGELEDRFKVKTRDENWDFTKINEDPLNDIIFTLTPFQKSVYDAIDDETTFEDIKRRLIRYRSGNFESKIRKNLDELIDLKLIEKQDESYKKIK